MKKNLPVINGQVINAPVVDGPVVEAPIVKAPVIGDQVLDNPIIDVSFVDASIVNQSNEGDMENLMELSKLDPPMFNGLCIECEDFQGGNICQNAKANRILQWVEDTYRYRKEREGEELYVTWTVLPFAMLNHDDDYSIDNINEIDE